VIKHPWSSKEEAYLREAVAKGHTTKRIAEALNRHTSSVSNKIERMGLGNVRHVVREGGVAPLSSAPSVDPVQAEAERQERLKQLKEERDLLQQVAGERSLREQLCKLFVETLPRFPAPPAYRAPVIPVKNGATESLILCLSDWHFGEIVNIERTRGFNAYDNQIAERRAEQVFASVASIMQQLQRGGWRFDELVISVNGDMLTGTIHDLERHADGNIVQSTVALAYMLARLIRNIAGLFRRVRVFFTAGNHTRMAPKMESKDPTRTWDAILGFMVKMCIDDGERILVEVPNAYACAFEVAGHTFVQTHGHQIKGGSFGGLPWYGINRMVTNYNALEASRGGRVAGWLLGHFHQYSSIPNVSSEIFVNGSLISGTEWTIDTLGKNDRPCQWLLGVHEKYGVTHRWPLWAETEAAA
jgi:hypothetical protein